MTIQPKFRLTSIRPIITVGDYIKRVYDHPDPAKPVMTRPPATYSNQSHSEVLNFYWDMLDAEDQKKYLKEMNW